MTLQLHNKLILRPICDADLALLCEVYSSTRKTEMDRLENWTDTQKESFLKQQYNAQYAWYRSNYKNAHFWVLERKNTSIGRLYLDEDYENSIRIIDITLLPEWRNKGLGESILGSIIEFASLKKKPVTIHVESFNPAKKLYERLGFKVIHETNGVYHLMERKVAHYKQKKEVPYL